MTRFFVRVGLGLAIVFAAFEVMSGVIGTVLPSDGEIRYLGYHGRSEYAVRSLDLTRGISIEAPIPSMQLYGGALSPDGAYLWFSSESGTFVFDTRTQHLQQVFDHELMLHWFHNSPEVLLEFFPDIDTPPRIFRANIDGSDFREITPTDRLAHCAGADISPDDGQIAFDGCSVQESTLSFMNSDGTNFYHLPDTFSDTFFPSWSPDGNYVAFTQYRDGLTQINMSRPDGSEQRSLISSEAIINDFLWSPDSSAIATIIRSAGGGTEVMIARLDGQLSSIYFISTGTSVRWSPDGRILMTTTSPSQGSFYYTFTFYDPSSWQVLYTTETNYGHVWSPDGRMFAHITTNYNELCVLNVADWSTHYCVAVNRPTSAPPVMVWLP